MLKGLGRLFVIKTRFEACIIIYALALGACGRGVDYLEEFPGIGGKLLFLAATGSVFLAGGKIFDCLRFEKAALYPAPAEGAGQAATTGVQGAVACGHASVLVQVPPPDRSLDHPRIGSVYMGLKAG